MGEGEKREREDMRDNMERLARAREREDLIVREFLVGTVSSLYKGGSKGVRGGRVGEGTTEPKLGRIVGDRDEEPGRGGERQRGERRRKKGDITTPGDKE